MNKGVKYNFMGENKDVSKSKHPTSFYYEGQHIRLTSTGDQTTGSIINEKGNEKVISIPDYKVVKSTKKIEYGNKELVFRSDSELIDQINSGLIPDNTSITDNNIIGHANTRTGVLFFVTSPSTNVDSIWYVEDLIGSSYDIELLYVRSLNFSINDPIQALFNYENDNIQKVYWVDNGRNQIRNINIKYSNIEGNPNLIDLPSSNIETTSDVKLSQPIIEKITSGGTHTAGKIQYAYNLFRLNSAQTKISPLSELVPLAKGTSGGGDVNEVVGAVPNITIDNIDQSYDYIRVYAIKYTSYNQVPSISLIEEAEIGDSDIKIFDDGNIIEEIPLSEFLFLGSDPIKPKHIFSKDNRLFPINIKTVPFTLPEELDCRAYSFFSNSSGTYVYDEVYLNDNGVINTGEIPATEILVSSNFNLPKNHSAINLEYDRAKYLPNSNILGGEGKFIKYSPIQTVDNQLDKSADEYQFFKDEEIYRLGIQFYNTIGQISLPQWIADFKAPKGNLEGFFNTLYVELKPEFYTFINNYDYPNAKDKIVGYKIIRADRTERDKTIYCQGISSGMMVNAPINEDHGYWNKNKRAIEADNFFKMPNILMRNIGTSYGTSPLQPSEHLQRMQFTNNDPTRWDGAGTTNPLTEVQFEPTTRFSETYQYNSMFQIYSPDIKFSNSTISPGTVVKVKGACKNVTNNLWAKEINVETKLTDKEAKVYNGVSIHGVESNKNIVSIKGNPNDLMDRGIVNNENGPDSTSMTGMYQIYRDYTTFIPAVNPTIKSYPVFGRPEITERGQSITSYNKNSKYKYTNTLEGFLSDGEDDFDDDQSPIISINSYADKCVTVVLGEEESDYNNNQPIHTKRPSLEKMHAFSGINDSNCALILEVHSNKENIYLGNIYGGNTYEDKKRTNYIEIGRYKDINSNSIEIYSPGDTFVQNYKFLRLAKTNQELYVYNINQFTEIVEFPVETTVDLKNRNDESISSWDATFQFNNDDYYNYNRVYSQQPTLVKNTDVSLTFREIKNFDTMVQASKLKIPNEPIDSWTEILQNESINLDGKYGPINGIASFKDKLYTFQDNGIANIQINPRIQVQTSDGLGVELGTGKILYDYEYLSTNSGSINKWGIVPTGLGIYYYDALRKGIGRVPDSMDTLLSDVKGQHSYFNDNYIYDSIKADNPLIGKGVVLGYDNFNKDVYITLLQRRNLVPGIAMSNGNSFDISDTPTIKPLLTNESITKVFNERYNNFIDQKLYYPNMYINIGDKLLLLTNKKDLYEQFRGKYNYYFDEYHPSYVTIMVNPESDYSKVFNNIQYNSELYLNDVDQPHKSLTHIQAWSEYQNSGKVPLVVGRSNNLRRKFREWKALIPRNNTTNIDNNSPNNIKRDRIRNPWIFLKLELDNKDNYRLVLHDIIIYYTI